MYLPQKAHEMSCEGTSVYKKGVAVDPQTRNCLLVKIYPRIGKLYSTIEHTQLRVSSLAVHQTMRLQVAGLLAATRALGVLAVAGKTYTTWDW